MGTRVFIAIAVCWGAVSWGATPAYADCTDPASPGVDWRRCYKDGRNFSNRDLSGAKLTNASCDNDTVWPDGTKGHGTKCPSTN